MEMLSEQSKRILTYIRQLAQNQGYYGRILDALESNYEVAEEWLSRFHGCKDIMDFAFAMEC